MSDAFRARLRRLRREADPPEGPASGAAAPGARAPGARAPESEDGALPPWLRARLGRDARAERAAGRSGGPPAGLEPLEGGGAQRITRFELAHVHGTWALGQALGADPEVLALIGRDRSLAGLDPGRAVYLDIETTGLSGGAGTWPYLVALGRFRPDHFELWQGFMHGPEDEPGLMAEVARRVADAGQLVTFFGKSFDRHRLEDKMRVCGVAPPFERAPHLDLFHACRRLYGEAYVDGRLQTMERALCGVERADDLPGSMAPAAWFDFLAGRAHRLEDVFRHNLDDVLSLVTLTAHLARTLGDRGPDGRRLDGHPLSRARGLARVFAAARRPADELAWVERALEVLPQDAPEESRREHRLWRALARERAGDVERALGELLALTDAADSVAARAGARAALVLERRRELHRALEVTERAREGAERFLVGTERQRLLADLHKRRDRLRARIERAPDSR